MGRTSTNRKAVIVLVFVLAFVFWGTLWASIGMSFRSNKPESTLGERINTICGKTSEVYDWQVYLDQNLNPTHTIMVNCVALKPDKSGYFKIFSRAVSMNG